MLKLNRLIAPEREDKFFYLCMALFLLILLYPYFEDGKLAAVFVSIMFLLIPLAGVYAASGSRRHLIIAAALCVPAQLASIEFLLGLDILPFGLMPIAFTFLFFVFTLYVVVTSVLKSERVTTDTLFGAAAGYLLFGLTWAVAFLLLENVVPGSFTAAAEHNPSGVFELTDFLYASFVTLTTLGYGDITPVTSHARSLAVLEAVTGVLYLAFMIGRLVGSYAQGARDGTTS